MANVGFVLRTSQKCKDLQWEINAPSPIDLPLETLSLLAFGSSVFSHGGWLVSQGRHLMVPELQQRSPRLSNLGKANLAKSGKVWENGCVGIDQFWGKLFHSGGGSWFLRSGKLLF